MPRVVVVVLLLRGARVVVRLHVEARADLLVQKVPWLGRHDVARGRHSRVRPVGGELVDDEVHGARGAEGEAGADDEDGAVHDEHGQRQPEVDGEGGGEEEEEA